MNKQEVLSEIENLKFTHTGGQVGLSLNSACYNEAIKAAILLVKQLDEPKKVVIPKFIADAIETCKELNYSLYDSFEVVGNEVCEWLFDNENSYGNNQNQELYMRAWLYGYEVEKKTKYLVKVKDLYFVKWDETFPIFVIDDQPYSKNKARHYEDRAIAEHVAKLLLCGTVEEVME